MSITGRRLDGRGVGFWLGLVLVLAAVWRIGVAAPVAAQARTKVNPLDGLTYVWIPPGTFQMGCSPDDSECASHEKPAHSVTLTQGFWIGQTPVTQVAYAKAVGGKPSSNHFEKGDQFPVEAVAWDEAQAYCNRVAMRLPTEAEWEYAARGGSPAARYGPLDRIAWYHEDLTGGLANYKIPTHPVAQKEANAYGLYDMLGSVEEWVADWDGPYDGAAAVDPKGPPTGKSRLLRGGYWTVDAKHVRVSARIQAKPGFVSSSFGSGFRCAGN
jgi:formylglycine-generating enzyme required for sulfatase activity